MIFNDFPGLNWSRACVFDIWSLGLAAVETAETPSGSLGWIGADEDSTWYNALYHVALSLIRQYAVMSVNDIEAEIFRVPLGDMLHAISTFDNVLAGLTAERKAQLVIADIPLDLARADLRIHEYDSDSDASLPPPRSTASSRAGTPPPQRSCLR